MPAIMKTPCRGKGASESCGTCAVVALQNQEQSLIVKHTLQRLGWQVREAPSAAGARRLIRAGGCKVAVLAIDLNDESGWLTCAKLKLKSRRLEVFLVGPDTPGNRSLARFAGATALLSDPVEIADWLMPATVDLTK
jgi:DNA-binding response OmpR family regulator